MSSSKQDLIDWINADCNREIEKLENELAEFKMFIEKKRNKFLQAKERNLAFLNIQFPQEWNSMILQCARIAYNNAPSYYGRKLISGNIPIGLKLSDEQVRGFENIELEKAVHTTFENIRHAANPVHEIKGIGYLEDDRVSAPEHSTFNFQVLHDLPVSDSDDFQIISYRVFMGKIDKSLEFSIEVRWRSKTIQPPRDDFFETANVK